MSEQADCPICSSKAKVTAEADDKHKIDCSSCGIFHIARSSMAEIAGLPESGRQEELAEAKRRARPGAPPLIYNG